MHRSLEKEKPELLPDYSESIEQISKIRLKIRFDYQGIPRPARFFFGGKGSREIAEEMREQQAALWRNVPMQGVRIEDVKYCDLYTIFERAEEADLVYAPLVLVVTVDCIEDCLRFICRDEFKRMEIIEPPSLTLNNQELERLLYRFSETVQQQRWRDRHEN